MTRNTSKHPTNDSLILGWECSKRTVIPRRVPDARRRRSTSPRARGSWRILLASESDYQRQHVNALHMMIIHIAHNIIRHTLYTSSLGHSNYYLDTTCKRIKIIAKSTTMSLNTSVIKYEVSFKLEDVKTTKMKSLTKTGRGDGYETCAKFEKGERFQG